MSKRIDKTLFKGTHYLGRPADFTDKIIKWRVEIINSINNFTNKNYTIADIGCGNGATLFAIADKMKFCTGFDIYEGHKKTFNYYKKKYNINNCEFIQLNIEKEKYNKQFDRIMCFEVIEHLEDDKNVKNFINLLKPNGLAVFSVPNKWWIFETHGAKLPLLPWNRVPFFSWLPTPIHEKFANARIYTKKRIVKLLKNSGFKIIEVKYMTAPLDVLKEGKIKNFLTKKIFNKPVTKIPFFAPSIFILAKKNI